jgi:hypothetical protein
MRSSTDDIVEQLREQRFLIAVRSLLALSEPDAQDPPDEDNKAV